MAFLSVISEAHPLFANDFNELCARSSMETKIQENVSNQSLGAWRIHVPLL
jgi:hypothetical protein